MMTLNVQELDQQQLDAAARHYEEQGFILLEGLQDCVTARFRPVLAEMIGISEIELNDILDPTKPADLFPPDVRQRLARIPTSRELGQSLLSALSPVLTRLIGPLAHVSSTFHGQFKGGAVKAVDHGGYIPENEFMEVHGAYLLHQDFAGAGIPTSPSMVTLWVGANTTPDWNLRLYPGSHRHGLLCEKWLDLQDEHLAAFGDPIDIQARVGSAVLFNGLMVHGTSNAGPRRRVSCDIRFFPLCGFLPSEVHSLDEDPYRAIQEGLGRAPGPVLRAPLLETLAYLGEDVRLSDVPPYSVLNWVNYVAHVVRGESDEALPLLERFVNGEIGCDPPEAYTSKFHGRPLQEATIHAARQKLVTAAPRATEQLQLSH